MRLDRGCWNWNRAQALLGRVSMMVPSHDWQLILGVSFELGGDCPPECPQVASRSVVTEKLVSPEAGNTRWQESEELCLEAAHYYFCHVLLVKEGRGPPPQIQGEEP